MLLYRSLGVHPRRSSRPIPESRDDEPASRAQPTEEGDERRDRTRTPNDNT